MAAISAVFDICGTSRIRPGDPTEPLIGVDTRDGLEASRSVGICKHEGIPYAVTLCKEHSLARALMQKDQKEDTRQCYVRGPAFEGIEQMLERTQQGGSNSGRDVKVRMVHGIGTHLPGYSTRLAENLARELELTVVSRAPKVLTLRFRMPQVDPDALRGRIRGKTGDEIGTVTVNNYRSKRGDRGMSFYELTWSEITEADKRVMSSDDSGEYSFRRAGINKDLKKFINSVMPDPLIYLGDAHDTNWQAVSQTLCWMFTQDNDRLPDRTDQICQFEQYPPAEVR